ncbi:Phage integrase family protein [Novosphingobium sp. CF614]|uniref:integrase arm-type DNA-binding domain-containing protein n=1 Tax=Novosphingobium sp. CF614 TaxID=1884364 RepID=UPI0008E3495F|nr:integrase arm-type DNA-binding domain-containing protein [Novosphingobium sp. CF614]SFG52844.1 Phage integrase family protein [Novosphingobium sp. CF614]
MATKKFTDPWLRGLKAAADGMRDEWLDEAETGLVVTVNSKRRVTFWFIGRFPKADGTSNHPGRRVLGDFCPDDTKDRVYVVKKSVPVLTLDKARQKAREWKAMIADGSDPGKPTQAEEAEPDPDTVATVFAEFFKRHAMKEGQKDGRGKPLAPLRSAKEIKRIFEHYIFAGLDGNERWRDRSITSITRRDVTALLDTVQDSNGATQADAVLAQLSSMFNWYAARGDDFVSPIVRGMKRTKSSERKRKRILNDGEIRIFWQACETQEIFGAFCQLLLLTLQRREKLRLMHRDYVTPDGLWTIPTEEREKGNAEYVRLSPLAMQIVRKQPTTPSRPYIFQGRLDGPINGFTDAKAELDAKMEEIAGHSIPHWVLHDLRRTGKTLMIRAGVSPHVSERVLGHVIPGVEGVYDQHDYLAEKTAALRKLGTLVTQILNPKGNVIPMKPRGRSRSRTEVEAKANSDRTAAN